MNMQKVEVMHRTKCSLQSKDNYYILNVMHELLYSSCFPTGHSCACTSYGSFLLVSPKDFYENKINC